MIQICKCVCSCTLLLLLGLRVLADETIAIKADHIDTVTSDVIENGVILIQDGKISELGTDVEVPSGAEVIDAGDKTVFPGIVHPYSTIGLSYPGSGGPASNPHYRVADELYPFQDEYKRILQAGFTTLALVPMGQGIAGQGAIVRPVGKSCEAMLIAESGLLVIGFRTSENAKRVIKGAFESAKKKPDPKDPKIEPLTRALQGKIPTIAMCPWPRDTIHLLELLKPYDKMKLVLLAGPENYRVADKLAKQKIPVIYPAQIDFEQFTRDRVNVPKTLAEAGVKIACTPKTNNVTGYEDFLRQMAELVKSGLDRETARKAITINPAEMLAMDYRLGSLEAGKDANLLILTGDPLEAGTQICKVMIEGKIVYQTP
ncbi:MAG: amidohydrolase family protein [Phycisphaerales bacterium]|nr:MAG: amidohydrolase family protein [Phycisphaerales bacterium]